MGKIRVGVSVRVKSLCSNLINLAITTVEDEFCGWLIWIKTWALEGDLECKNGHNHFKL